MKFSSQKKRCTVVIFILAMLLSYVASAQIAEPINSAQGDVVTLRSNILKEDRQVMIYTPTDSLSPGISYPVVYVLDPDNHFGIMVEYSKYLSHEKVRSAPPLIIVGIIHKDRIRELTPSRTNYDYSGKLDTSATFSFKNSGGNEKLFEFIKKELMPYVNVHYKTQPYQIFAGHSFGALTTINCLINYSDLFNAYIAVSPSFWWDRTYLLKAASEKLKPGTLASKVLFYSDGNEGLSSGSLFHSDVLKFDSLLKQRSLQGLGLSFEYMHYPKESHMTVPIKSYYDGLRFIFRDWDIPEISDEVVNAEIIMNHYRGLSQRFGYVILPNEKYFKGWGEWLIKSPNTRKNGISLLEMNTKNYPLSSEALAALGAAYLTAGDKDKAFFLYKKAHELSPSSDEIKVRLRALMEQREISE